MNTPLSQIIFSDATWNQTHWEQAPHAFFQAWKTGAELAGHRFFSDGTRKSLDEATCKWDLRPNVPLIEGTINVMSHGEKVFLAAMVSFYNAEDGAALLQRVGVGGMADLGVLDLQRRHVITALLMNYGGW